LLSWLKGAGGIAPLSARPLHAGPSMEDTSMRIVIAVLFALAAGSAFDAAKADPYRWCAQYGGSGMGGGGTNYYFVTLQQCELAISGMGGFCTPNQFYDGRPVVTPEDSQRARKRARAAR
jgi:hypothetical protein